MDIYLNSTSIHARPTSVRSMPENGGCVTVNFEGWNELTFYCGTAEMALDMEAAIKGVINAHRDPVVSVVRAPAPILEDDVVF